MTTQNSHCLKGRITRGLKARTTIFAYILLAALTLSGCQQKNLAPAPGIEQPAGDVPAALEQELQVREDLLKELLAGYTFYKGTATIKDDSVISSETERDKLNGSGEHYLTSDEVLVYDPKTEAVYLIARSMYYIGEDSFTFTDLPTGVSTRSTQYYSGENHEYYGTGILVKKELMGATATAGGSGSSTEKASDYELVFTNNPVRMRPMDRVILTNPPPHKTYWVTLSSPAVDSVLVSGVTNQPEEVPYEVLNLMPNLPDITFNRTYNHGLDSYAQLTNGFYGYPSGYFECEYTEVTVEEALEAAEEIRDAQESQKAYEAMAENQPEAWKETARLGDALAGAADASAGIQEIVTRAAGEGVLSGGDSNTILRAADALVSDPEVTRQLERMDPLPEGASVSSQEQTSNQPETSGTPRKLEGVVLEASGETGAGPEQQRLTSTCAAALPELEGAFQAYADAARSFSSGLSELRAMAPITADTDADAVLVILEDLFGAAESLEKADSRTEALLNPLHTVLSRLNRQGEAPSEVKYERLNTLFKVWAGDAFLDSEPGSAPNVNLEEGTTLPSGYPVEVVPLPKNAKLIISEALPDSEGQPSGYTLTLKTSAAPSEIAAYYTSVFSAVAGVETTKMGDMTIFSGQRLGFEFSVMVTANSMGGTELSMVQISVMAE
ncbi:hypothetical protein [Acidaminobacter sp.]|uniref:hypothetical protein n=1 Tax=Acidaminobacter sp. TaxID=1872102 RepID=UPI0013839BA7|nr:hypothetical protein [Acidaminobacter sp.]MDK9710936.1 hypothetical protein [Acidaminobacter sp.]MZQ98576.1 hypothetical protein [Acidaminobacter sp.]